MQFRASYLALIFLNIVICSLQEAHAEISLVDEDHYDGSEFKAPSFKDPSFDKPTYREDSSKQRLVGPSSENSETKSTRKRNEENGVRSAGGGNESSVEKTGENSMSALRVGPVHELPGDWVPDSLSLTSNGGFTISPDNGSPVPYNLNGHVDIQRDRP